MSDTPRTESLLVAMEQAGKLHHDMVVGMTELAKTLERELSIQARSTLEMCDQAERWQSRWEALRDTFAEEQKAHDKLKQWVEEHYHAKKGQWLDSVTLVCADFPNVAAYIAQKESEVRTYREALERIAGTDYRGNRSSEAIFAAQVLKENQ